MSVTYISEQNAQMNVPIPSIPSHPPSPLVPETHSCIESQEGDKMARDKQTLPILAPTLQGPEAMYIANACADEFNSILRAKAFIAERLYYMSTLSTQSYKLAMMGARTVYQRDCDDLENYHAANPIPPDFTFSPAWDAPAISPLLTDPKMSAVIFFGLLPAIKSKTALDKYCGDVRDTRHLRDKN